MRIGFIGDLHMDYNTHHDFLAEFTREAQAIASLWLARPGFELSVSSRNIASYMHCGLKRAVAALSK